MNSPTVSRHYHPRPLMALVARGLQAPLVALAFCVFELPVEAALQTQSTSEQATVNPATNQLTAALLFNGRLDQPERDALQQQADKVMPAGPPLNRPLGQDRQALVHKYGGTVDSEFAVQQAQEWIAKHQLPDGSWNFDHTVGPDADRRGSPNPGDFKTSRCAATGMALLVFLGTGNTHQHGDYQEVVQDGLNWLVINGRSTDHGLSFYEQNGALYSHAIATMALCEALALSGDMDLTEPCEKAVQYTLYCQDPIGGGWRYEPRQSGDTSVFGWQLASLKAARLAGIHVPLESANKATRFLNSVDDEDQVFYGYTHPATDRRMSTTAIGLLGRVQLGRNLDHASLIEGARWIAEQGPSVGVWDTDQSMLDEDRRGGFGAQMYRNHYATQFLFQMGGPQWDKWNEIMRDFLVATQSDEGVTKGSWFFVHPHETGYESGGRLYATAMAAMTLQVYYRFPRISTEHEEIAPNHNKE